MDDMLIAEAFDITELRNNTYESKVYTELMNIKEYSEENLMKLNLLKTKFMVFNKTRKDEF